MVRVTGNFQSESPLHPKAFDVLHAAFDSGWADPAKLSQSGAKARQLKNNALESIATSLLVEVDSIVPVSPASLGYFLGIQGLFPDSPTLIHGATDRKDVFAIAAKISGVAKGRAPSWIRTRSIFPAAMSPFKYCKALYSLS